MPFTTLNKYKYPRTREWQCLEMHHRRVRVENTHIYNRFRSRNISGEKQKVL